MSQFFEFPCGCKFPIDESRPSVHGHGAIIYDPRRAPLNCPATWELIGTGRTKGVFQLESQLGRSWAKRLKPGIPDLDQGIEQLSALVAILRPGTLKAIDTDGVSMTERYCRRKNMEEEVTYTIPALKDSLDSTYGVNIYQEQSMDMARRIAAFNLQEADMLRKAIGKKDTESMAKTRKMFLEKAHIAGIVTDEEANAIFDNIQKSQRYAFNKCTSFDTKILRPNGGSHSSRAPYTVEEMYRIRNDLAYAKATGHEQLRRKWKRLGNYGKGLSMCEDGRIRPNTITDIQPAGFRTVYKITLENGATIRTTGNHKFPTNSGEMTVDQMLGLQSVKEHDGGTLWIVRPQDVSLYVRGEYEATDFKKCSRFSDHTNETRWIGNWSYTNQSYSKFQEFRSATPDICFDCGKRDCRIETHHVNGDRRNSEPENLVKLCVSCHKRREYASGRTKRGEKGYPSELVRVLSIVEDGQCMTYDVTMGAPNHNFVVDSGIVTCNSHSVRYALNAYMTAHEKAHFPLYFFTSYLRYALEKQEPLKEIRQLINDARSFGYTVEPPRFADANKHFQTDGEKITFGLCDVKGIGDKKVDKMRVAIREAEQIIGKRPMEWDWYTFLVYFSDHVDSIMIERMIQVGAMRHTPLPRQRMLAEFDTWKRLTDRERESVAKLGEPLHKMEAEKHKVPVEVDVYEKSEEKAYKAAMKEYAALCNRHDMDCEAALGDPDHTPDPLPDEPTKPRAIGKKTVMRTVNKKDEDGKVIYHLALDDAGEPLVLDPPRSCRSLSEALEHLQERPGAIATKNRRARIDSMRKSLVKPPRPLIDHAHWVAKIEEETLGVPITVTHVDASDKAQADTTIKEYEEGKDEESMIIAAQIDEIKEYVIGKNAKPENVGRKMCRLVISDPTGSIENVVMFADAYEDYGHMVQRAGTVVGLQGQRSYSNHSDFIVSRVWEI